MDENTRFLIERMDALEDRVMKKIDSLMAFRYRLLGIAAVGGTIGAFLVEIAIKSMWR